MELQPFNDQQQIPNNMLILPDDVLYIIFKLLDVLDIVAVEKVCRRFQAIAQDVYKSHKVLDLPPVRENMCLETTVLLAKEIISRVGIHVEKLTFNFSYSIDRGEDRGTDESEDESEDDSHERVDVEKLYKLLRTKNFTNLQAIDVINSDRDIESEKTKRKIRKLLKTLKKVEYNRNLFTNYQKTPDEVLIDFLDVPQLEELKLQDVSYIRGTFLAELSNITVLSLYGCHEINPQYFYNFCNNKPNLRSLNIVHCYWIDTMCLRSIGANLQNLEELYLSFFHKANPYGDYLHLSELKKLKHLEVNLYKLSRFRRTIQMDDLYIILNEIFMENELVSLNIFGDTEEPYDDVADANYMEEMKGAIECLTHIKKLQLTHSYMCWKDAHLNYLPCENTLENLILYNTYGITPHGISQLIARCSSIKFIRIYEDEFSHIDVTHLVDLILPCVKERSHMLELRVNKEQKEHYKEKYGMYYGVNSSRFMLTFD